MFLALDFTSFEPWLWIIIFAGTFIYELLTIELDCLWFSLGAVLAFILHVLGVHFGIQVAVFLVSSCTLLFTVGKWARESMKGKNATNIEALINQEIIIIKDTSHYVSGEGKINGIIWTTICLEDEEIKEGSIAIINEVNGNKLYIKSKERKGS